MKFARPALALAMGTAVVIAGQAGAAVPHKAKLKPVCNLIVDKTGDANGNDLNGLSPFPLGPVQKSPVALPAPSGGPSVDALDIISADIAADKKNVTAVIRVKKLAATAPTGAPTGMRWALGFTADGNAFTLMAHTNPLGTVTFDAAYVSPTTGGSLYAGTLNGVFDLAKSEIHITAPTSLFASTSTIKAGTAITDLFANAGSEVLVPDKANKLGGGAIEEQTGPFADTASSTKNYIDGIPSCVTPGA